MYKHSSFTSVAQHKLTRRCKIPAFQGRKRKRLGFHPWVQKIPWRRAWQPIPVFLPENPMDKGACDPEGCKELDTTEMT